MQEMTPEVCEKTEVGTVARLTDARDQKQYWVAKLADGNCWMTQNLDLDLGVKDGDTDTTVLTPADSDVSNNWTPLRSTEPAGTITSANTNTEAYSGTLVCMSNPTQMNIVTIVVAQVSRDLLTLAVPPLVGPMSPA